MPAAKEYLYLDGKVKFINYTTPNQWDKWAVQMYIKPSDLDKVLELQAQGVKNTLKKDEGGYYLSFSRPAFKKFPSGDVVKFDPPKITDENGTPTSAKIGKDSEVSLKLEIYSHPVPNSNNRAKAIRWEGLKIIKLVASTAKDDEGPETVW